MISCVSVAELVEELLGAGQGLHRADDLVDVGQLETVLVEDFEPPAHELVVVRLVAGRAPEGIDSGLLGKGDPHLGDEDSFEIEADDEWRHERYSEARHGQL